MVVRLMNSQILFNDFRFTFHILFIDLEEFELMDDGYSMSADDNSMPGTSSQHTYQGENLIHSFILHLII